MASYIESSEEYHPFTTARGDMQVSAKKARVPRSLLPMGSSRLYWSYQETYRETCHQEVGVTTQVQLTTADELLRHPSDGYRYELIEGELKKMAPAGNEHGMLALRLAAKLWNFVDANELGVAYAAETGFKISANPDTVRAPDAAFVSQKRLGEVGPVQGYWPGAPDLAALGSGGVEAAAMAAGLHALRHDHVRPGRLGGDGLGDRGGGGEPGDAALPEPGDECGRVEAHDGRGNRGRRGQQRLALSVEVGRRRVAGVLGYRRPPGAEEAAQPGLMGRVTRGRGVRHPKVDLKRPVAGAANLGRPGGDAVQRQQQRPARAEAARVGDGGGERGRAGASHRRRQDRRAQAEAGAERLGAAAGGQHRAGLRTP